MAITSADIANVSFSIDRKGYDVDEVDDFLEHVADEIDALNDEIADLRIELSQQPLDGFGYDDDATQAFEPVMQVAEPVAYKEEELPEPAAPEFDEFDDRDEVIADLEARLAAKDAEIAELEAKLRDAQADGSAISAALIVAQRSADEIIVNANAQADQVIAAAKSDADRIIVRAEEEKTEIEDEIDELEKKREESRARYQELLRDFIDDAAQKLSNLEPKRAVHGGASYQPSYQVPINPQPQAYEVPQQSGAVAVAATPIPSAVEKDLSGFGDSDDDFALEDLD